ncbi:PQQ-binding-like beta-propeller repeat protein [Paenibacillus sp. GCM10027627]|uniref:outer membrane protein assembly factor BamB family protein n=1 Tax=unclassified Paenibacillus TaxID=185978 RepID=UPI00363E7206
MMIRRKRRPFPLMISSAIVLSLILGGCSDGNEIQSVESNAVMFRADASHSGSFEAIAELKGVPSWTFRTKSAIYGSPIARNNIVYFGNEHGEMYAIDGATETEKWKFQAKAGIRTTPALWNKLLFFADDSGVVYALHSETGVLKWQFNLEYDDRNIDKWDYYRSSPVIYDDTVYIGNGGGTFYALKAGSGEKRWEFKTDKEGAAIRTTAAVHEDTLYFGDWRGYVYALSAKNGTKKWSVSLGGPMIISPLVFENMLYVGGRNAAVMALNTETGKTVWSKVDPKGSWMPSSPAIDAQSKTIYFGSSDALTLSALDSVTGEQRWQYKHKTHLFSSPAIAGGVVYIASGYAYNSEREESLLAFDSQFGKLLWSAPIGRSFSSPFVDGNKIYITDLNGTLHAFQ